MFRNIVVRKLGNLGIEETHAVVSQSRHHRFTRQQDQRSGQAHGGRACLRRWRLARRHGVCAQRLYLHIDRIGLDGIDKRAVSLNITYANHRAVAGIETGNLVVTGQPLGDIDKLILILGIAPNDIELIDDGVGNRPFEILGNLIFPVGKGRAHVFTHQQSLRAMLFQIDGRMVYFLTAEHLKALWHTGEARHCQHQTIQQRVGNFQIPVVLDMSNGKEALAHGTALLYHFVIGVFVVGHRGVLAALHLCLLFSRHRVVSDSKSRLLPHDEQRDGNQISIIHFTTCFLPSIIYTPLAVGF